MQQNKAKIIEGMEVLDEEKLIKMLGELPNSLLAVVDTQVDTDQFTEFLQRFHPDLLSSVS